MSFLPHQVIGNYECLGIISKPRSGVTYKVRNLSTGDIEALRALRDTATADAESAERLAREIRVHARLTHPNVVGFHDAFELDGQLVMTTDYVEGATLAQVSDGRPMPPREAAGAILQALDGLAEAHALGIIHRGITADHVIIAQDGAVKLGGFDLAKPACDTNLTKIGAVYGDPKYVAPEQVLGKPSVDARADLYSMGIALYRALTGRMPFDAASEIELLSAHVNAEPVPPSAVQPAIPKTLDAIVLRALKKNPDERFAAAAEFRDALAAAMAGQAAPVEAPASAPRVETAPVARSPWAMVCVAAAGVAGVVAWIALR